MGKVVAKAKWMGRYYTAGLQSVSVSMSMVPDYCPCELTGHWQGIGCSRLSLSDSPVGQPAKRWACQQHSHTFLNILVAASSASLGGSHPVHPSLPKTPEPAQEWRRKRQTGMGGRLHDGIESCVKSPANSPCSCSGLFHNDPTVPATSAALIKNELSLNTCMHLYLNNPCTPPLSDMHVSALQPWPVTWKVLSSKFKLRRKITFFFPVFKMLTTDFFVHWLAA